MTMTAAVRIFQLEFSHFAISFATSFLKLSNHELHDQLLRTTCLRNSSQRGFHVLSLAIACCVWLAALATALH